MGKKELLVLFISIVLVLFLTEAVFRVYAYSTDHIFAPNDEEVKKRTLYRKLASAEKVSDVMYGGRKRWTFDNELGLKLVPRYRGGKELLVVYNDSHYAKAYLLLDYINHHGMRQFDELFTRNKTRIALLGDSFTLGDEAPMKYMFANQLRVLANGSETVNLGMSGAGTEFMYASYVLRAANFSPDVTVMTILVDDLSRNNLGNPVFMEPYVVRNKEKLEIKTDTIITHEEFFNSYKPPIFESSFFNFIKHTVQKVNKREKQMRYGLELLGPILDDLNEKTNGNFVVALILGTEETEGIELDKEYYDKVKALLMEKGIPFVDSSELFKDELDKYEAKTITEAFYLRVGGHFNVEGNAVFANGLINKLEALGHVNKTLRADRFVYDNDWYLLYYVDENEKVLKIETAYDVIKFIPK